MMKVVRLEGFDDIHDFGIRWNDFVSGSRDDHIFLTLEWLDTWWKYYGDNGELTIIAVKDKDKILAIAPLMNTTYEFFGFKLRKLEFIGTPSSDYHSFILTKKSQVCVQMLLDYINEYLVWDCIELKCIPENAETVKLMRTMSRKSLELRESVLDICPVIILPNTFEEYLQTLGNRMRRNLRNWRNRATKENKVEFKMYNEISCPAETMHTFFELHQKRWWSKGYDGQFVNETFRSFHLDVAKRFAEKGWLRLCFLTMDDRPVSVLYAFEYGQKLWCYMSGFDPDLSRYGVGHLTFMHLIRNCIERGLKEFDFMRGKHSYKNRWNPVIRRNIELRVTRFKPIPIAYDWIMRKNTLSVLLKKFRKYVKIPIEGE